MNVSIADRDLQLLTQAQEVHEAFDGLRECQLDLSPPHGYPCSSSANSAGMSMLLTEAQA